MKWKFLVLIIGIAFIFIIVIQKVYKQDISKKMQLMERNGENWNYQLAVLDYFEKRLVLPPNLDSLISYLSKYEMNLESTFVDPFSSVRNYISYIPLFDSSNLISGYVLLSSGPDRQINNKQNALSISQLENLCLYNNELFNVTKNNRFKTPNVKSIFLDRVFGKKDIGIFQFYIEEYYKSQHKIELTIDSLLIDIFKNNISKSGEFRSSNYHFEVPDGIIFIEKDERLIANIKYGEYLVICNLVKQGYSIESLNSTEGLSIYGILASVDLDLKIIEFDLCFVFDE